MKSIIFSLLIALGSVIPLPTIILINGVPHFVILDEDFYISQVIQSVPDYFTSDLSHEQIVSNLISSPSFQEKTAELPTNLFVDNEVILLENVEFVQFYPSRALLDRVAVDRIRGIAQGYTSGEMKTVYLKISHKDNEAAKILAENRINSVKDLLISFGVDQYAIYTEMLANDDIGDNSFVRVDFGK